LALLLTSVSGVSEYAGQACVAQCFERVCLMFARPSGGVAVNHLDVALAER